jgi:hypothetical protein
VKNMREKYIICVTDVSVRLRHVPFSLIFPNSLSFAVSQSLGVALPCVRPRASCLCESNTRGRKDICKKIRKKWYKLQSTVTSHETRASKSESGIYGIEFASLWITSSYFPRNSKDKTAREFHGNSFHNYELWWVRIFKFCIEG